ncbi:MAG: NfeD family protein [Cytophagales bacterium]|nr:NfeD family protein [Cytophagales bacterium]
MELSNVEIWAILGVIFLIAEIFAVSFFFMFFGLGALATTILTYLDITPDLVSQVISFIAVSGGSLLLFRKQLLEMFNRKGETYTEMVNEKAKVSMDIPQNGEGKVFYRGADWIAEALNKEAIKAGSQVLIRKVDGIKLIVEPG